MLICSHPRADTCGRWALVIAALLLPSLARSASAQSTPAGDAKIEDVVVWWSPQYGEYHEERTAYYYFNGRFVGFDDEGFIAVLDRLRQLPRGTSVVWGPDPDKMISRPNRAHPVPKLRYPARWREFHEIAEKGGLVLSGLEYDLASAANVSPPRPRYIEPSTPLAKGEVVLSREQAAKDEWPSYFINGRQSGTGREAFLATLRQLEQLPDGTTLRLRHYDEKEPYVKNVWVRSPVPYALDGEFARVVVAKRFVLVYEVKKSEWPKWLDCPAESRMEWRNVTARTPQAEVLYLIDGKVAGLGDRGFDRILAHAGQLPVGAYYSYPQLRVHGRAFEGDEEVPRRVRELVPFGERHSELKRTIEQRRLVVGRQYLTYWPKDAYSGEIDDGTTTVWYFDSLFRVGIIVRDGKQPTKADAVVSWQEQPWQKDKGSEPAVYSLNGQEGGRGTPGFLEVLKRLDELKDGAVVQINPVCVRTQGPFYKALIFKGQRHFEASGEEPFRGLIDLLVELAERKKFRVELIPDEKSRSGR